MVGGKGEFQAAAQPQALSWGHLLESWSSPALFLLLWAGRELLITSSLGGPIPRVRQAVQEKPELEVLGGPKAAFSPCGD